MKEKRSIAIGGIGIVFLLASVILFIITREDGVKISEILGFGFMIYAELVVFGGLIAIECIANKNSQIMIRSGLGGTLTLYGIITFSIAFVYMCLKTDGVKFFLIIQILLFAVASALLIAFYVTSQSIKKSDDKILNAVARVSDMIDDLSLLKTQGRYGKQLDKLIEDLKYSDTSSSVDVDDEIEMKIAKLELEFAKEENSEIDGVIEEIAALIKKRKVQVRNKKIGGI